MSVSILNKISLFPNYETAYLTFCSKVSTFVSSFFLAFSTEEKSLIRFFSSVFSFRRRSSSPSCSIASVTLTAWSYTGGSVLRDEGHNRGDKGRTTAASRSGYGSGASASTL